MNSDTTSTNLPEYKQGEYFPSKNEEEIPRNHPEAETTTATTAATAATASNVSENTETGPTESVGDKLFNIKESVKEKIYEWTEPSPAYVDPNTVSGKLHFFKEDVKEKLHEWLEPEANKTGEQVFSPPHRESEPLGDKAHHLKEEVKEKLYEKTEPDRKFVDPSTFSGKAHTIKEDTKEKIHGWVAPENKPTFASTHLEEQQPFTPPHDDNYNTFSQEGNTFPTATTTAETTSPTVTTAKAETFGHKLDKVQEKLYEKTEPDRKFVDPSTLSGKAHNIKEDVKEKVHDWVAPENKSATNFDQSNQEVKYQETA